MSEKHYSQTYCSVWRHVVRHLCIAEFPLKSHHWLFNSCCWWQIHCAFRGLFSVTCDALNVNEFIHGYKDACVDSCIHVSTTTPLHAFFHNPAMCHRISWPFKINVLFIQLILLESTLCSAPLCTQRVICCNVATGGCFMLFKACVIPWMQMSIDKYKVHSKGIKTPPLFTHFIMLQP